VRRIVIERPGGYDALRLVESADPVPGPGEVLVAVEACGVNYADSIVRLGLYASARKLHGYPITPGFEIAGRVAALGAGVTRWRTGDAVIGLTLFGGYADRVVLAEDSLFALPPAFAMAQGATLPTVFLTAWFMAHRQMHPQPDDAWLVHSAAGGVGSALVQLGRLAGCRVVGVVGAAHKVASCRDNGASDVIDKSTQPLWPTAERLAPAGYRAVFDANGVATLRDSYRHLAPTGVLAVYGFHSMLPRDGRLNWLRLARDWLRTPRFSPLRMTQENRSVVAANLSFLQAEAPRLREGMQWLLERFADGRLKPLPVETFALADAAAAQRRIESGATVGKLALLP
jgi:NADPH:quinone reductase-like Zn-dependent oxidoreductase